MHIQALYICTSIAMFSLKILTSWRDSNCSILSSVPQADAMTTAPSRQGVHFMNNSLVSSLCVPGYVCTYVSGTKNKPFFPMSLQQGSQIFLCA
jgi:hypothetical protein